MLTMAIKKLILTIKSRLLNKMYYIVIDSYRFKKKAASPTITTMIIAATMPPAIAPVFGLSSLPPVWKSIATRKKNVMLLFCMLIMKILKVFKNIVEKVKLWAIFFRQLSQEHYSVIHQTYFKIYLTFTTSFQIVGKETLFNYRFRNINWIPQAWCKEISISHIFWKKKQEIVHKFTCEI